MSHAAWFWVFYAILVLVQLYGGFTTPVNTPWQFRFGGLIPTILVGLLGLAVFGSPVK